jgi:hypothetical protein
MYRNMKQFNSTSSQNFRLICYVLFEQNKKIKHIMPAMPMYPQVFFISGLINVFRLCLVLSGGTGEGWSRPNFAVLI